jgi:hypothetical protein
MQFLVLIVFFLFAGVELFQWLKGVILPLPIYVLAGAFLAIASNYEKGLGLLSGKTVGSLENQTLPIEVLDAEVALFQAELENNILSGSETVVEKGKGEIS